MRKMKKFTAVLGAVMLAATAFMAVPQDAKAAANVSVTSSIGDSISVKQGDTFSVTYTYTSDNPNVTTMQGILSWDSSAVERLGEPVVSSNLESTYLGESGGNTVNCLSLTGAMLPSSASVTYEFRALSDCRSAASEISMQMTLAINTASERYPNTVKSTVNFDHPGTVNREEKNATCTESGYIKETCTVCGEVLKNETISFLGHDSGEWVTVKDATCAEPGSEELRCTRCQTKLDGREIPATGNHSYEWTVTRPATCGQDGEREGICSVCSDTVTEPIPATGKHTVDEWETAKEATCTEAGERVGVCSVCDTQVTEEIAPTGHVWVVNDETDSDGWKTVKEATVSEEGQKERICSVCGEKETAVIEKLSAIPADPAEPTATPEPSTEVEKTETQASANSTDSVKTGDFENMIIYLIVAAVALCGIGGFVVIRKKQSN